MKFLGLFILSAALYFTWGLFNGSGVVVSESTHVQIQETLSKEIIQIIINSNPSAYNIEVSDFWTETIDEENIEAHFKFSFEDDGLIDEDKPPGEIVDEAASEVPGQEVGAKIEKRGVVKLKKSKEDGKFQYWEASEVSLEGQKIDFKEGLTFSGEDLN